MGPPASSVRAFTPEAVAELASHRWPGNVRELAHAVERLVLLARAPEVGTPELQEIVPRPEPSTAFEFHGDIIPLRDLERRYASWALAQTGGHRGKTAEKLGVDPKTLRKWLGDLERDEDGD